MTVFYRKYQFAIALRMDYVISMKRYVNANFIDNMKSENLQKKFYNLYKKNQNMLLPFYTTNVNADVCRFK